MRRITTGLLIAMLGILMACGEMQYYAQSVQGQLDILQRTQDIERLLADDQLDAQVRGKLQLVLQARAFAAEDLGLSFNDSYTEYADLNRDFVVENLYAAEEFSTELYTWCYPVIGCANYRGYFDAAQLRRYREQLDAEGYDTYIGRVTAYSTLGWFDDPVLNTFVALSDYRLVGLIFHELAHQQIYVSGDTAFNESFATAVEQAGLERFYAAGDDANQLGNYRDYQARVHAVVGLAAQTRENLDDLYQQSIPDNEKRQQKAQILTRLAAEYAQLTNPQSGPGLANAAVFNNARLGAMAAYHQYAPAFLNMLQRYDRNFAAFYDYVRTLSQLPPEQRERCLALWGETVRAEHTQISSVCEA